MAPTHPTTCAVSSPETPWQRRPKCPRPVTEHEQQKLWQRFPSAPARSNPANTFDCSRLFGKKNATKYWLTQKDFSHVKAAPDESRGIITSAQAILDRENYFVREVDRYLRHNDFLNLRKKEILYKKWLEDVSEPLLQKIEDKMDSQSSDEIEKRKEEQLSLYLNYCKKKTHPTTCAVSSPETPWQRRPKCPRSVTEHEQQKLWQRFPSAPARSNPANTFDCSRLFGKKNATKYWLTQKDFSHVKAAPDESRSIITSAQAILDRENYFVREVDRYLRHNDFLNLRKKEILYKKWLEDVSEPLLQKIEDKMDSQSSDEIEKRKEEQLSLYLNYCKKKGYVALETYDPSEYDPFLLQRSTECWKVPCLVTPWV